MKNTEKVLAHIDWALLAKQKQALVAAMMLREVKGETEAHLDGLLCFLDGFQDAAEADGFPVVFLTEYDENRLEEPHAPDCPATDGFGCRCSGDVSPCCQAAWKHDEAYNEFRCVKCDAVRDPFDLASR